MNSTSGNSTSGKGRPTPTRKEAEAAARERARLGADPKAQRNAQRAQRKVARKELQEAYRTGDDRLLPQRDQGPVRRFTRDFVDARIGFAEMMLPLFLVILVLGYVNPRLGNGMLMTALLLGLLDMVWLRFRLRRQLKRRFPEQSLKGTTYYALVRALQQRFLRMPRTQVKIGQALPDTYR